MKQDRLSLTAGFMPAVIMALLLLLEGLLQAELLPQNIWVIAGAEVAAYVLPLLILRFLPDKEGKRARFRFKGYRRQTIMLVFWMSLTAAMLAAFANGGVALLLGGHSETIGTVLDQYEITGFWQAVLVIVVLPSVVEELFFRGVMFSALERCGTWPALLLTSIAFAMIHGDLYNFAGPLFAGLIYGYLVYTLDSVLPAIFAHMVNNGLMLLLYHMTETFTSLDIWDYVLLFAVFIFCMFLSLATRALDGQIEKGRIKRLQYRSSGETLTGIFVSPGMWLLLLLFAVRVLY